MPGFHVVAGACAMPNGNTELRCFINTTRMEAYESHLLIGASQFCMDQMTQHAGTIEINYGSLLTNFETHGFWWIARDYKRYNGLLDMHIRWCYSPRVFHYILDYAAGFLSRPASYHHA